MISRGIREFVSRDWAAVRESKDAYWSERVNRLGPLEGFRIADQLRRQAFSTMANGLTPRRGKMTSWPTRTSPSFSAVPLQPAALELLTALSPVLVRWGRWYVFGAQAVIAASRPDK
jgi:hypothetical protein